MFGPVRGRANSTKVLLEKIRRLLENPAFIYMAGIGRHDDRQRRFIHEFAREFFLARPFDVLASGPARGLLEEPIHTSTASSRKKTP